MTPVNVMSGTMGDIFWDLAPWTTYEPGYDLGCSIYVANPDATEKEYTLIARLSREDTVISEEVLPVFGYTWFKVASGDFIKLRGALRFDESDSELAILLIERETEEVTDSVSLCWCLRVMSAHCRRPGRERLAQPVLTGARFS